MPLKNDLSRSLAAFEQDRTLVVVLEISLSTWLVGGLVPGVVRQPAKKLGADEHELLKLIHRWRAEASRAGREIDRICVAFEAGRDGFWLARWLAAKGLEAYVIHSASVAVSREHRRANGAPEARFSGLVARRAGPLRHGGHPNGRGGGRPTAEPRAGEAGRRSNPDHQSNESDARPIRDPRL